MGNEKVRRIQLLRSGCFSKQQAKKNGWSSYPMGTKVLACESGTVTTAGWNGDFGKCIIIDHGGKLQTVYGHLSSISVKPGQNDHAGKLRDYNITKKEWVLNGATV